MINSKECEMLETVLKQHYIPERYYSIGKKQKDSICIEHTADKWIVYTGKEKRKYKKMTFDSFYEACCYMFEEIITLQKTNRTRYGITKLFDMRGDLKEQLRAHDTEYSEKLMNTKKSNRMKVDKYVTKEIEVDVQEITLLSKEEYEAARAHIQPIDNWWWLRSSDYDNCAVVNEYGTGAVIGNVSNSDGVSVRPALRINPISENLQIGDMFSFGGYDWMVITETLALCNTDFCRMAFRNNRRIKNANVYELSDIKPYLDNWLNTEIQKEKSSGEMP